MDTASPWSFRWIYCFQRRLSSSFSFISVIASSFCEVITKVLEESFLLDGVLPPGPLLSTIVRDWSLDLVDAVYFFFFFKSFSLVSLRGELSEVEATPYGLDGWFCETLTAEVTRLRLLTLGEDVHCSNTRSSAALVAAAYAIVCLLLPEYYCIFSGIGVGLIMDSLPKIGAILGSLLSSSRFKDPFCLLPFVFTGGG